MNQPKAEQEPSMEEILASIRRIISDDGEEGDATDTPPVTEAPPVALEPAVEDDVLELTEIVSEQPEPEPEPEPDPEPEPEPRPEPEPALILAPEPEPEPEDAAADDSVLILGTPSKPPEMEEPLSHAPAEEDSLVSDSTSLMAGAAISKLREASPRDAPVISTTTQVGDKTVEAVMRELLRPMLKDWLDQNLPGIVEKIVEREIARVAEQLRDN